MPGGGVEESKARWELSFPAPWIVQAREEEVHHGANPRPLPFLPGTAPGHPRCWLSLCVHICEMRVTDTA